MWIASNFAFIIVAILNTGFFLQVWGDLTLFEKMLKILLYGIISFMFAWLWVGVSRVFTDSKCKKGKIYSETPGIWTISLAVLYMWIAITGIFIIIMICIFLYRKGWLECIANYKFPDFKITLCVLIFFLLIFLPFVYDI